MKKRIKVLLTCIGHQPKKFFLKKIKESKKYNYQIIGVDNNKNTKNKKYVDFFYKVPLGKHRSYNEVIYKICLKHKVNLILPGADEEVFSLIKNEKKLKKINCFLPIIEKKKLNKICSKINLCKYVKNLKIPFYKWKEISNYSNLKKCLEDYSKKKKGCVVKLPISRGGRGVYILDDKYEGTLNPSKGSREMHTNFKLFNKNLKKRIKLKFPILLTEKLTEPVYDIDILAFEGNLKNIVIRKRKISSNPDCGHIVVKNSKILKYSKSIVRKMSLSYLLDFDIMFDSRKNPKLIEINPRMSGSIAESYKKNIFLIDDLIDLIL